MIKSLLRTFGFALSFLPLATVSGAWRSALCHIYTGFLSRKFCRLGRGAVIGWRAMNLHGLHRIAIGERTQIDADVQLTAWEQESGAEPLITIGSGCLIRRFAHITASRHIVIGDNLLTGTNVLITDNAHGHTDFASLRVPPTVRPVVSKGEVVIGNNVWLGNNVCILPGVHIGDGVVVGANSVVCHDLPAYCVAAGVPAVVIKAGETYGIVAKNA